MAEARLAADGWLVDDARALAERWVVHDDFLLGHHEVGTADFVIGNPPYIRLEAVSAPRSEAYRRACSTMGGRSDVYVGFFEVGLNALRPGGALGRGYGGDLHRRRIPAVVDTSNVGSRAAGLLPAREEMGPRCRPRRHPRCCDRVQEFGRTIIGNNYNIRTGRTIGNASTSGRHSAKGPFGTARPWLGYLFLLEEEPRSVAPVKVREPFFAIDDVFRGASYKRRYEILCRRLLLQRLYDAACFVTASADPKSRIHEPAPDLSFDAFARAIRARAAALLSAE